jgi:hypothetical protein
MIANKKVRCTIIRQDSLQFYGDHSGFFFEVRDHRCHSSTIMPTRKALRAFHAAITEYLRATRKPKAVRS